MKSQSVNSSMKESLSRAEDCIQKDVLHLIEQDSLVFYLIKFTFFINRKNTIFSTQMLINRTTVLKGKSLIYQEICLSKAKKAKTMF